MRGVAGKSFTTNVGEIVINFPFFISQRLGATGPKYKSNDGNVDMHLPSGRLKFTTNVGAVDIDPPVGKSKIHNHHWPNGYLFLMCHLQMMGNRRSKSHNKCLRG